MTLEPVPLPPLPCPDCRAAGIGGGARIGNRRSACTTCNNFAQRVMRRTRSRLKAVHADDYIKIRSEVERDVYRQMVDGSTLGSRSGRDRTTGREEL